MGYDPLKKNTMKTIQNLEVEQNTQEIKKKVTNQTKLKLHTIKMSLQIYKPNKSNTGSAFSFSMGYDKKTNEPTLFCFSYNATFLG